MPIMKNLFLAYFFVSMLLSIVAVPSLLMALQLETETVLVLDKSDEESKESESSKKINLPFYISEYLPQIESYKDSKSVNFYRIKLHLNFKIEMHSPPPELI